MCNAARPMERNQSSSHVSPERGRESEQQMPQKDRQRAAQAYRTSWRLRRAEILREVSRRRLDTLGGRRGGNSRGKIQRRHGRLGAGSHGLDHVAGATLAGLGLIRCRLGAAFTASVADRRGCRPNLRAPAKAERVRQGPQRQTDDQRDCQPESHSQISTDFVVKSIPHGAFLDHPALG